VRTPDGDAAGVTEPVWNRPEPLGAAAGGTTFGLVAAPLLAGFALTAVVELVSRSDPGVRGDVATAAFATAAGLLIFTVQVSISASRYQVSPPDRIAWTPESLADPNWLRWVHDVQWRDEELARRHRARARYSYNAGIVAFLAGLVAVLLPDPGDWRPGRTVAVAVAGLALLVELLLIAGRPRTVRRLLVPTIADYEAERARIAVPPPPQGFRQMVGGEDLGPVLASVTEQLAGLNARLDGRRRWRWWG